MIWTGFRLVMLVEAFALGRQPFTGQAPYLFAALVVLTCLMDALAWKDARQQP